jgi:hypothetical protein
LCENSGCGRTKTRWFFGAISGGGAACIVRQSSRCCVKVITQHFVGGECIPAYSREGRVEDGRSSLGHSATLRFPSPLIEPDVRISCKAGGPGRAKLYDEIRRGRLRAVKIGRSTRILVSDYQEYLASLPPVAPSMPPLQSSSRPHQRLGRRKRHKRVGRLRRGFKTAGKLGRAQGN